MKKVIALLAVATIPLGACASTSDDTLATVGTGAAIGAAGGAGVSAIAGGDLLTGAAIGAAVGGLARRRGDETDTAAEQVGPPTGVTGGWPDAFRVLGATLPDTPSIVVLDELPWLAEQDEVFDGALQTTWDRLWSRRPVLLVLLVYSQDSCLGKLHNTVVADYTSTCQILPA